MPSALKQTMSRVWDAIFTCSVHGDLYIEKHVTLAQQPTPADLQPLYGNRPVLLVNGALTCPSCPRVLLRRHAWARGYPMPAA